MSSCLIVLCPNGRRVNVPVTPGTTLNTVKDKACEAQSLDSSKFGMRKEDMKKPLDLSFSFRLSGLANKAKLELFEQEQPKVQIKVALQLDTGHRLQGQVLNNSTLAQTIKNISKDGIHSVSHIMYMNRKIEKETFDSITLTDLGILKGSVMLRLYGVGCSTISETASVSMETPAVSMETDLPETKVAAMDDSCQPMEEENLPLATNNKVETQEVVIDRTPILFDPSSLKEKNAGEEMESDDFFEVTEKDMRAMLRDLKKITEREFRFKEKEEEKELSKNAVLRIRFPNGYILQQIFITKESTTDDLYSFVGGYLTADSTSKLVLYQAPPKQIIKQGTSLAEAGLTSTTLLHAGGDITLREGLQLSVDPCHADEQLSSVLSLEKPPEPACTSVPSTQPPKDTPSTSVRSPGSGYQGSGKPVPKWFKMK